MSRAMKVVVAGVAGLVLAGAALSSQAAGQADRPSRDAMVRIKGPTGFYVNACEEGYGINTGILVLGGMKPRYKQAVEQTLGTDLAHFKEVTDRFSKAALGNELLSVVQRDAQARQAKALAAAGAKAAEADKLTEFLEKNLSLAATYTHACIEAMQKLKK